MPVGGGPPSGPPPSGGAIDPESGLLPDLDDRIRAARILLVDDEPANVRFIEHILRRAGYAEVVGTSDSSEAVPLFHAHKPDLILLDLQMPGLDGFAIMERLRPEITADGFLPVLVLTGDTSAEAKQRALSRGAMDFLGKPFDAVELQLRIHNLLHTRLLHRALASQNQELEERVRERTSELHEALSRAEEASRAKTKFLSVMSHELRTPLTGIISHAELLGSEVCGPLTTLQHEGVTRISSAGWHLANLIQEILDFASGVGTTEKLRPESFDAAELASEALGIVASAAAERSLRLTLIPPPEAVSMFTDPTRVRRILLNLLSNAIKFTPRGEIRLRVLRTAAAVTFRVEDDGIGIAPEHLGRIWDPFWQVEDPLTRREGGAGLGLSVVRSQAQLLGAALGVESRLGAGSAFSVTFRAAQNA